MDFKTLVDTIFYNKRNWNEISDNDKDSLFFIFNRYMGKKYPKQAQFFNTKNIDKAASMDIWFAYLKNEVRVPKWFWLGPTKKKSPVIKDWQIVQDFWELSLTDIHLLCELFPDDFKQEIKRIDKINKEQAK